MIDDTIARGKGPQERYLPIKLIVCAMREYSTAASAIDTASNVSMNQADDPHINVTGIHK